MTDFNEHNINALFTPDELALDLPYVEAVPLFVVNTAYNIMWRRYTLLARLIEQCDLYTTKHARPEDRVPRETACEHLARFTVLTNEPEAAFQVFGIVSERVVHNLLKTMLLWHVKKSDLTAFMTQAGEVQVARAEGLPLPADRLPVWECPWRKEAATPAPAFSQSPPASPSASPPASGGACNRQLVVPTLREAIQLVGGWYARNETAHLRAVLKRLQAKKAGTRFTHEDTCRAAGWVAPHEGTLQAKTEYQSHSRNVILASVCRLAVAEGYDMAVLLKG